MLQRFKGWTKRMFLKWWIPAIPLITQEEFKARQKRIYVSKLVMLKISERMRAYQARKKAEKKRAFRAARRAKMLVKHKDMGLVDDAKYGEKPPRMSLLEARVKLC